MGTTHLKVGAEQLASMTDAEVLDFWNELLEAKDADEAGLSPILHVETAAMRQ